jgi:hypothetical protein
MRSDSAVVALPCGDEKSLPRATIIEAERYSFLDRLFGVRLGSCFSR